MQLRGKSLSALVVLIFLAGCSGSSQAVFTSGRIVSPTPEPTPTTIPTPEPTQQLFRLQQSGQRRLC